MNPSEPDWAYVARSLVKVLAVTVALWLAVVVADRTMWLFVDYDGERMARVYGTAAAIANPDKRLHGYDDDQGLLHATHTLWGEPRRAGPGEGGTYYEITENLFGAVRAPSLDEPAGSVAEAIGSVESELVSGVKTRETFDALPRTLNAVAVVDFTQAMTTERLIAFNGKHKICGGEDVSYLYSPSYYDDSASPSFLNAVVWNRAMPVSRTRDELAYQCESEPRAALAAFRTWVGLLDRGDDLTAFGLTDGWLAMAAREGVVHGLLIDGWKLADLRKLLDDPEVETVHLADVAFDLGRGE
ncbi:hypothetical protein [Nonomuraea sp. SBT364]|uniref:hypothetical protein n=1 Tax=Nonomuraea sp. SBT364 TaxID=1580530 RepID=UPI00066E8136|nr:hypothetical protein [Nonomuraea sp. SBT364]